MGYTTSSKLKKSATLLINIVPPKILKKVLLEMKQEAVETEEK